MNSGRATHQGRSCGGLADLLRGGPSGAAEWPAVWPARLEPAAPEEEAEEEEAPAYSEERQDQLPQPIPFGQH